MPWMAPLLAAWPSQVQPSPPPSHAHTPPLYSLQEQPAYSCGAAVASGARTRQNQRNVWMAIIGRPEAEVADVRSIEGSLGSFKSVELLSWSKLRRADLFSDAGGMRQ